jgi:succinate dehydrogenase flavin-adding protein (antitoxin of CptAB toxin-antitoxin module)
VIFLNEDLKYGTFRYFLECYFNPSAKYEELETLVKEFNSTEESKYRQKLQQELEQIFQLDDWDNIQEFVRKYAMRKINSDRLTWFIRTILHNLNQS